MISCFMFKVLFIFWVRRIDLRQVGTNEIGILMQPPFLQLFNEDGTRGNVVAIGRWT